MDVTVQTGSALDQPTRARLFVLLGELKRPAGTEELADRLEMHPNGIRSHLEFMQEAGLVVRERERRGRGRPRDLWAIDPTATPGGDRPTAYAELSSWLVKAVESGAAGPDEIEDLGQEIGLGLTDGNGPDLDPETRFHDALAAMGFQPGRRQSSGDEVTYCLGNCPYRDTARTRQPLICGLHRGITRGLLKSIEPESTLTEFVVKEPDRAGCEIRISGPLAGRPD